MVPKEQADGVDRLCRPASRSRSTAWPRPEGVGSAPYFHGYLPGMRAWPAPPAWFRASSTLA
eukprot:412356-Prymnesium_polylepis.1